MELEPELQDFLSLLEIRIWYELNLKLRGNVNYSLAVKSDFRAVY